MIVATLKNNEAKPYKYKKMTTSNLPDECRDMTDIRREIDAIDRLVIALIGRRFKYVQAAAKFKRNPTDVASPERFKAMLAERRSWAQAEGLCPDAIEKMYADLVNHFIAEELKTWKAHH